MRRAAAAVLVCGCAGRSLVGVEQADGEYWKGYLLDAGEILSSPREWKGRDWLALAGVAGAATVIYTQDGPVRDAVQDARSPRTDGLASFGKVFGSGYVFPGLAVSYGIGCACGDGRLKEASLLGFESCSVAGGFTAVLKALFGRRRPFEASGPDDFDGPSFFANTSMPSGHTTVAFALATTFALEYEDPWLSALAYALAGLCGWSRMNDDKHWASDVFVGATVGILTTRGIYRARARRKSVTSAAGFRLYYGDLTGYRRDGTSEAGLWRE